MSTNEIPTTGGDVDLELTADDVLADVRSTARAMVRGGCCTFEQVLARALELAALADDEPAAGSVERVVRLEWDAWAAVLAGRAGGARRPDDGRSDHVRVERAFAALERQGVATRLGRGCCQGCVEDELPAGPYAVVTQPDLEQVGTGRLVVRCGVVPDGAGRRAERVPDVAARVAAALSAQGLDVRTDRGAVVVHVTEWRKPLPAAA